MKDDVQKGKTWTINGRFIAQQVTGVQRYACEIVRSLDEVLFANPDVAARLNFQLVMPADAKTQPLLNRIPCRASFFGSGHLWEQLVLPWYERTGILSLGNFGPAAAHCDVVCIHDANTFLEPDSYSKTFRSSYRALLPIIGKRAGRVATVSEYSANMLARFGIAPRDKIFVAGNGHEHVRRWNPERATLPLLKSLRRPYVLLLGSQAKHKNIEVVLAGAQALDAAAIDLVIVGSASRIFLNTPEVRAPNTHYVGYVSDDDLAALYERAFCLAFPSTTEGFGLPPLEAMASGCPVISSNAASLREVGGEAVQYVNPLARADWPQAIIELSKNEQRRKELIMRGTERARLFSWQRSAEIYIDELLQMNCR